MSIQHFLKNHPFAVEAFFESSLVLTFAIEKGKVQNLIPECLQPDTFKDQWAFIAMAIVQTRDLRPKGFPKFLGNDFLLVGYRVFVRYITRSGKRLRGLYILKSETDKEMMRFLGAIFTGYKYASTDINMEKEGRKINVQSVRSNFLVEIETGDKTIPLPQQSPFGDWKEARRFAGPLPFTFSYDPGNRNVLLVEGLRQNWHPAPVNVIKHEVPFLHSLNLGTVRLANAFLVTDIPYCWKKGETEKWNG